MRPSFQGEWNGFREKHRAAFTELLAMDPFEGWERNRMPEAAAEDALITALKILYAGDWGKESQAFLRRAIDVSDRVVGEGKLQSEECSEGFPENRARLLRARAYAAAIIDERLDSEALLVASRDYEEWSSNRRGRAWDSQAQAYRLSAVRLALIGGDPGRARTLLSNRKRYKWHEEEWGLLGAIASAQQQPKPTSGAALETSFDQFFDRVRDPRYRPEVFMELDILRLELGALRDRYFVSHTGEMNWKRIIEAIAQ